MSINCQLASLDRYFTFVFLPTSSALHCSFSRGTFFCATSSSIAPLYAAILINGEMGLEWLLFVIRSDMIRRTETSWIKPKNHYSVICERDQTATRLKPTFKNVSIATIKHPFLIWSVKLDCWETAWWVSFYIFRSLRFWNIVPLCLWLQAFTSSSMMYEAHLIFLYWWWGSQSLFNLLFAMLHDYFLAVLLIYFLIHYIVVVVE